MAAHDLPTWLKDLGTKHNRDFLQYLDALASQGVKTVEDLTVLTEEDIKELVKDTGMGKPARRQFINALKGTGTGTGTGAGPATGGGGGPKSAFVLPMSEKESKCIEELGAKTLEAQKLREELNRHKSLVAEEAKKTKDLIRQSLAAIINEAKARTAVLEQMTEQSAQQTLQSIEQALSTVIGTLAKLDAATKECKLALEINAFEQLKQRQDQIVKALSVVQGLTIDRVPVPPAFPFQCDHLAVVRTISSLGTFGENKLPSTQLTSTTHPESTILSSSAWDIVLRFFDSPPTSRRLLWRGSIHGFAASTFHSKCDNQGPTLTVIRTTTGYIFGGFNDQNWTSSCTWSTVGSPWLFSLTSGNLKLVYSTRERCYGGSRYGPTFGTGHDIYIADSCNSNTSNYCSPCSFRRVDGGSYPNTLLAGSNNFTVSEIEVFGC